MCTLDIILSICLIAALVQGLFRGFTEQVIALVSLVAGVWIAFQFSRLGCGFLQPYLHISERVLHVFVFIMMTAVVICIFHLIGKVIKASIRFVMLGWLDRLLGALFSTIKVALVLGIVIILFNTLNTAFSIVPQKYLDESVLYPQLKSIAYGIFPYFKQLLFK